MGLSERTAGRHWAFARAWLRRAVEGERGKSLTILGQLFGSNYALGLRPLFCRLHIRGGTAVTEEQIFLAALDLPDAAARAAYLDEACGGDAELRRQVEALLAAHFKSGEFLDVPAAEQIQTESEPRRCRHDSE